MAGIRKLQNGSKQWTEAQSKHYSLSAIIEYLQEEAEYSTDVYFTIKDTGDLAIHTSNGQAETVGSDFDEPHGKQS